MAIATEATMLRLMGAVKRHDVGDLKDAIMAEIGKGAMSQSAASTFITLVEALPKVELPTNKVTEPGYYAHPADGRTVKVQRSKKGYLYALDTGSDGKWKFVSGLLRELDAAQVAEGPSVSEEAVAAGVNPELVKLLAEMAAVRQAS
jgi:hypothetical protein